MLASSNGNSLLLEIDAALRTAAPSAAAAAALSATPASRPRDFGATAGPRPPTARRSSTPIAATPWACWAKPDTQLDSCYR